MIQQSKFLVQLMKQVVISHKFVASVKIKLNNRIFILMYARNVIIIFIFNVKGFFVLALIFKNKILLAYYAKYE